MRRFSAWLVLLMIATGAQGQTPSDPLYADSTLRLGSGYGSAGDLFAFLPGASFHDPGSIGLPAPGTLFASPPARLNLVYDGFRLDDPLTGRSDLNLIPVEGIASQALFIDPLTRPHPEWAASQTLEITSRDLAADTLRTQVAYRTGGSGYDDIDVRAGLRYSERLWINAGGVLKNYAGTTAQLEKYRAQKINLALTRTFGSRWRARYHLLYNVSDLNLPLPEAPALAPGLRQPHQKLSRYDHGLEIDCAGRWRTLVQLTDQHRERFGYRHSVWDETTDVLRLDLASTWLWRKGSLSGMAGGAFRSTGLKSAAWGDHGQSLYSGWGNLALRPAPGLQAFAQLRVEKGEGMSAALLPQLQLRYDLARGGQAAAAADSTRPGVTGSASDSSGHSPAFSRVRWQTLLWYERSRREASLAERYETGPFALGDPELGAETGDYIGLGFSGQAPAWKLFLSLSTSRTREELILLWNAHSALPRHQNRSGQQRFSLDAAGQWRFSSWFTVAGKAKQMLFEEETPFNQPATFAAGWLAVHHIFFRHDLDVRLRLGVSFWGRREEPIPWYVEASPVSAPLQAAAVPWLDLSVVIRDATLFFALQNPLGIDYEVIGGYPQPRQLIRWGFVWNFYD